MSTGAILTAVDFNILADILSGPFTLLASSDIIIPRHFILSTKEFRRTVYLFQSFRITTKADRRYRLVETT